jgi:voltage-gated potassium channel
MTMTKDESPMLPSVPPGFGRWRELFEDEDLLKQTGRLVALFSLGGAVVLCLPAAAPWAAAIGPIYLLGWALLLGWACASLTRRSVAGLTAALTSSLGLLPILLATARADYWWLSNNSHAAFTLGGNPAGPMSYVDSWYFTLTVFTTTGFGDYAPASQEARELVSLQMALDVVLLVVITTALATIVARGRPGPAETPGKPVAPQPEGGMQTGGVVEHDPS